jgi:hypothetical protein
LDEMELDLALISEDFCLVACRGFGLMVSDARCPREPSPYLAWVLRVEPGASEGSDLKEGVAWDIS